MPRIRGLFDPAKPIDRRIEKVINYELVGEEQLKAEVTEYVATESIQEHFHTLLDVMDKSMSGDVVVDTAVWVSGFYGSGKSSFTKYLGFALDPSKKIGGRRFLDFLVDQFTSQTVKQKLKTMAAKHPLTVIMVDLASNQLAGAGMADVSSVLYWQAMQWAGYSRDRKIAQLELMLEKDGKREAFEERYAALSGGKMWAEIQSNPLVAATWAARLASEMYPEIWKDQAEFFRIKLDEASFEEQRVKEMLDIIARRSGTDKVVFIVDEVGQYVAGRDELILNLDGLAKNVKNLGRGKAWLVATAQQTLTEDNPQAQLNSSKISKLNARFPLPIDLEASDIRTICHRRLLAKSAAARTELGGLFDRFGQKIIMATKLTQARVLSSSLDRETFIDLYPFLPQHLDLLLILLGRLAKTSGGLGLRSAIKVVQDVLIDSGRAGLAALADEQVGALANVVVFYDCLRKDIQRSFPHVVQGVGKAVAAFGETSMEGRLAKAVGVLQALDDFPLTAENAAALMLPSVEAEPLYEAVRQAAKNLLDEPLVPFAVVDGKLRFMSPVVDDLNKKRQSLQPTSGELRDVMVQAVRDIFSPKPIARTASGKSVGCGVKIADGSGWFGVQDDGEEIQLCVSLQKEAAHKQALAATTVASRAPEQAKMVYVIAPEDGQLEHLALEQWRSRKIFDSEHARAVDKEVTSYLSAQRARAQSLATELITRIKQSIMKGSFVFQGQPAAVATPSADLGAAVREELAHAGEEVFRKFRDAPVQADGSTAEGFLRTANLAAVAAKNDPLGLVDKTGGRGAIKTDYLALRDLHDYLSTRGLVDGKKLLDDFAQSPYGWFKDTTRYIISAMLAAGLIKLRVSGIEIPTPTPQAIEAVKGQQSFHKIGIMLRGAPPDTALLLRTSERLLELTGKSVLPLERDISTAVLEFFPDFQNSYASVGAKLTGLGLAGSDRAEALSAQIQDLIRGEASDAPLRLGQEDSELFRDLRWAREAAKALKEGFGMLAEKAHRTAGGIAALPDDGGALESLKSETAARRAELLEELQRDDWFSRKVQISQGLSLLDSGVVAAIHEVAKEASTYAERRWAEIEPSADFAALGPEDREAISLDRPAAVGVTGTGIEDLEALTRSRYSLAMRFDKLAARIGQIAVETRKASAQPNEYRLAIKRGPVRTVGELDDVSARLGEARGALERGDTVIIE